MTVNSSTLPVFATRRAAALSWVITVALMAAGFVWFAYLSIAGHTALQTTASDLGYYSQAVWNTAQGHPFRSTLMVDMVVRIPGDVDPALLRRPDSLLAYHVEPVILVLGLIARWWPGPEMLLIVQALAAVAGAWAVHRLAARVLGTPWAGPVFAAVYLLAPPLHWALTSDFHPVVLGVGAVAFVYDFALGRPRPKRGRAVDGGSLSAEPPEQPRGTWASRLRSARLPRWRAWPRSRVAPADLGLLIAGLLALTAREDVALIVAPIALYRLVRGPGRWAGGLLLAACLVWLAIVTVLILPAYGTGDPSPFLARFSHLGGSSLEIATTMITQPWRIIALLARPEAHNFWLTVTAMTGGLWLIGLPAAVPALPLITLNLASNWPWAASGGAHYSILTVPAFVAAAAIGAGWLARLLSRARVSGRLVILSWVLGAALFWARIGSLTPLNPSYTVPASGAHEQLLARFAAQIPPDASLSASSNLFPHLDNRSEIALFPTTRDAEYVLIDVTGPAYPTSPADLYYRVWGLLDSGAHGVVDGADGYLLLRRGAGRPEPNDEFWTFVRPGDAAGVLAQDPTRPEPIAIRWETFWDGPDRKVRLSSDWIAPAAWPPGRVPAVRAHLKGGIRDLGAEAAGFWWMQAADQQAGRRLSVDFPPVRADLLRSVDLLVPGRGVVSIPIAGPAGAVWLGPGEPGVVQPAG